MTKLHHLQALRGIAANLVVLDHIFSTLIRYGHLPASLEGFAWHFGEIGVGIFFVISGFIMVYTSHGEGGKAGAPYLFLEKRIIRVVPLYWLATLLAFAMLFAIHKPESVSHLVQSLLFIPYYSGGVQEMRPVLGQGWTINYEILFYAAFAISLFLKGRWSLWFLIAVFCGLALGGAVLGEGRGAVWDSYTDPIILLFLMGVLVGWVCVNRPMSLPVRWPLLLTAVLLAMNLGIYVIFAQSTFTPVVCAVLSISTVVVCALAPAGVEGPVARAWEMLGDGSYSTYLFHTFLLAVLNRLVIGGGGATMVLYGVLALAGSNIIGIIAYTVLERPLTQRLRSAISASRRTVRLSSSRL
ncbi:MAG TPA: acyltransferase [Sphingobium sp.]|uniref:acyltransferase family protein n=1 Tax=Sphingobium sp. TaxID=1912891 RepID=UPI002ED31D96